MNKLKLLPLVLGVIALAVTHQGTVAGPDTKAAAASTAGLAELAKAELPPAPAPEVTPEPEPPAPEVKPEPKPAEPKRPDPKPGYRYECGPYGCKLVPILPSTTVEAAPVQCQGGQCYTRPSVRYQPSRSYGPVRTWFKNRRR